MTCDALKLMNNFFFFHFVHYFQVFLHTRVEKKVVSKDVQCSETDFSVLQFLFCAIIILRDMVNFIWKQWLTMNWGLAYN